MNSEKKNKKEPWRIILFIISVLFILFMWIKKDIVSIYTTMPEEQVLPLMVTTIAVSLVKVIAIAGGILLIKLLVGKFGKK
ncbi:MAG: hypothetical protein J6B08_04895 [Ruminiclostridium sp.]|nr:hypothetical protein [Ruminiclostridium sp.]